MPTEGEWGFFFDDGTEDYEIWVDATKSGGMIRGRRQIVDGIEREKDARRIVTAVNCHEELVGIVDECREDLVKYRDTAKGWWPEGYDMTQKRIDRIDAALAKAREGEG